MALETRLIMSSIFPNSICGFLFSAEPGERGGIPMSVSGRGCGRGGDGGHDLRRQSETNVLRHHFYFFELGETLVAQEIDGLFDQDLGSRGSGSKSDGLDTLQPFRLNGAEVLDQVRGAAEVARHFD